MVSHESHICYGLEFYATITPPAIASNMTNCPTDDELADFHLGNMPPDRLEIVSSHLETCERCETRLDELELIADDALQAIKAISNLPQRPASGPKAARQADALAGSGGGAHIEGYENLEEIGRGGMGVVYKAWHSRLNRFVAVKMLSRGEFAGVDDRKRFLVEAEAIARLKHPNIVQIYEVGECQTFGGSTLPYFALEYVEGGSLTAHTGGRPQPAMAAAEWVEILARAVDHAHENGVIHRDLKPSNVLVSTEGQLKLCDFGVAKLAAGPDLQTRSGILIGTPEYMAPEQAGKAQRVGPAADVWSLGAILYSLLTGRPPFAAPDSAMLLRMLEEEDPLSPRQLQPAVPRDLETICLKCLQKNPASRYATAGQLADDLGRYRQGISVLARPVGTVERTWKWVRRRPGFAAAVTAVLALLFIGLPGTTYLWLRTEAARQQTIKALEQADKALEEADNSLYFNRMALAQQGLAQGDVRQARLMLERSTPQSGQPDRRGWEWYYLESQANAGRQSGMQHVFTEWSWIYELAWSPDSTTIASVGGPVVSRSPGQIKLWDVATRQCIAEFAPAGGATRTVDWHPDGKTMVTGGRDNKVTAWDMTVRPPVPRTLWSGEGNEAVNRLRYSPDGNLLVIGGSHAIRIMDLRTGKVIPVDLTHGCEKLEIAPSDGENAGSKLLLVYSFFYKDAPFYVWEISPDGTAVKVPHAIPSRAHSAVNHGTGPMAGTVALTHGYYGDLEIWDKHGKRTEMFLRGQRSRIMDIEFDRKGNCATATENGAIEFWEPRATAPKYVFWGHTSGVMSLTFSPDGTRLASASRDGDIHIHDVTRDPRGVCFRATTDGWGEHLGGMEIAPDGNSIVVVSQLDREIHRYDVNSGLKIATANIPMTDSVQVPRRDQAFAPDGERIALPDVDRPNVLKIWRLSDGAELGELDELESKPSAVAWSADGRKIAAINDPALGKSYMRLWDAETTKLLRQWDLKGQKSTSICLDRTGSRVAATFFDSTDTRSSEQVRSELRIWETASGNEEFVWKHDRGIMIRPVFRPDGGQVSAIGFSRNEVFTWNLNASDKVLIRNAMHFPLNLAYSPDGDRMAAICVDNRVRVWDSTSDHEAISLISMGTPGSDNYAFNGWVAFSRDGKRLIASDWTATVNVWTAEER